MPRAGRIARHSSRAKAPLVVPHPALHARWFIQHCAVPNIVVQCSVPGVGFSSEASASNEDHILPFSHGGSTRTNWRALPTPSKSELTRSLLEPPLNISPARKGQLSIHAAFRGLGRLYRVLSSRVFRVFPARALANATVVLCVAITYSGRTL